MVLEKVIISRTDVDGSDFVSDIIVDRNYFDTGEGIWRRDTPSFHFLVGSPVGTPVIFPVVSTKEAWGVDRPKTMVVDYSPDKEGAVKKAYELARALAEKESARHGSKLVDEVRMIDFSKLTATREGIQTDQGNGGAYCGNCSYDLAENERDRCPNCERTLIPGEIHMQQGGSDF